MRGQHAGPQADEVGQRLGGRRDVLDLARPGTRSPTSAPAVAIRWSCVGAPRAAPCSGRGVMTSPSDVCSACPPSRVISAASAASRSVSCPRRCAMPRSRRGGVGQGGERGDGRGELAGVVQVEVDAVHRAGPGHREHVAVEPRRRAHAARGSRAAGRPAASCCVGQPGTRTVPPATSAAHRNGAALDRSGSTRTSRPAIGPGRDLPDGGPRVVDRARRPRAAPRRSSRCAAGSAASRPVCRSGQPALEPRGGEQQPGDELARPGRVDVDLAADAPSRGRAP